MLVKKDILATLGNTMLDVKKTENDESIPTTEMVVGGQQQQKTQ